MNNDSIDLSCKKEVFWDDFLIDKDKTTAKWRVMNPVRKESCFSFDQGYEKEFGISYPCILKDDSGYKMYYIVWKNFGEFTNARCYLAMIESSDGINWKRPELNMFEHPELKINNAVMENTYDGFCVFSDQNPICPEDEKYKAVGVYYTETESGERKRALWCFTSPDGYKFSMKNMLTDKGFFDSLNTVMYKDGKYICYLRGYHEQKDNPNGAKVRDIRVMYSDDFINWTEPQIISFTDGEDEPLYTNNAIIYPEADHLFVGFPVRYHERKEWTLNMEQIKSCEIKKSVAQSQEKRSGLAVTDCIFMSSRNGKLWHRYNEAFLSPAYENKHNWVYGDCYLAYGLVDSGRECYYLYAHDNHRSTHYAKPLIRYEIRKDGFACIMAESTEETVVTKPLTFSGSIMHLNFTTSAKGYIYVDVLDKDGNELSERTSFEIFGDNIDRKIYFDDGSDFSEYQGQEIRLRFKMSEAKLYSVWFE